MSQKNRSDNTTTLKDQTNTQQHDLRPNTAPEPEKYSSSELLRNVIVMDQVTKSQQNDSRLDAAPAPEKQSLTHLTRLTHLSGVQIRSDNTTTMDQEANWQTNDSRPYTDPVPERPNNQIAHNARYKVIFPKPTGESKPCNVTAKDQEVKKQETISQPNRKRNRNCRIQLRDSTSVVYWHNLVNKTRAEQKRDPHTPNHKYDYSFVKAIKITGHTRDEFMEGVREFKGRNGIMGFLKLLEKANMHLENEQSNKIWLVEQLCHPKKFKSGIYEAAAAAAAAAAFGYQMPVGPNEAERDRLKFLASRPASAIVCPGESRGLSPAAGENCGKRSREEFEFEFEFEQERGSERNEGGGTWPTKKMDIFLQIMAQIRKEVCDALCLRMPRSKNFSKKNFAGTRRRVGPGKII